MKNDSNIEYYEYSQKSYLKVWLIFKDLFY